MAEELRIVATVANEVEAEMVMEQLAEADIRAMPELQAGSIRLGAAAPRDIYVSAADYERALEVITAEVPSEAELATLSEEAASHPQQGAPEDG